MFGLVNPADFFRDVSDKPSLKAMLAGLMFGGLVVPVALLVSIGLSERSGAFIVLAGIIPFQYVTYCILRSLSLNRQVVANTKSTVESAEGVSQAIRLARELEVAREIQQLLLSETALKSIDWSNRGRASAVFGSGPASYDFRLLPEQAMLGAEIEDRLSSIALQLKTQLPMPRPLAGFLDLRETIAGMIQGSALSEVALRTSQAEASGHLFGLRRRWSPNVDANCSAPTAQRLASAFDNRGIVEKWSMKLAEPQIDALEMSDIVAHIQSIGLRNPTWHRMQTSSSMESSPRRGDFPGSDAADAPSRQGS